MVFVINKHGKQLMPCSNRKARLLLKNKKAIVLKTNPFTIKLLYGASGYRQPITLGIDTGSKVIGLSASTAKKELYASEVTLRSDIVNLLTERRSFRRTKRNKLRYRQPRFLNRGKKGWLAPSVLHKINTHLKQVEIINSLLPISKIIVEVASFDIQKLNNPGISGKEYQQGELLDFFNIREYVLFRDNHKCQHSDCKHKSNVLHVHHIVYKTMGGSDSITNLITLCSDCNTPDKHKKGTVLWDWCIKKKKAGNYKDATFMGIMRWAFYNKLKETYNNVSLTYGYLTKNKRIVTLLSKTHRNDAYCIAGNLEAVQLEKVLFKKKVRVHNRQIHKANFLKGHKQKLNQSPYEVHGFRLFDKVDYNGVECFITGRRATGYFVLKNYLGETIHKSAKAKELKLKEKRKSYLSSNSSPT